AREPEHVAVLVVVAVEAPAVLGVVIEDRLLLLVEAELPARPVPLVGVAVHAGEDSLGEGRRLRLEEDLLRPLRGSAGLLRPGLPPGSAGLLRGRRRGGHSEEEGRDANQQGCAHVLMSLRLATKPPCHEYQIPQM